MIVVKLLFVTLLILSHSSLTQSLIFPTLGAGTLTFTIPALSSLTQTQLLYLTAGGLSKESYPSIYFVFEMNKRKEKIL